MICVRSIVLKTTSHSERRATAVRCYLIISELGEAADKLGIHRRIEPFRHKRGIPHLQSCFSREAALGVCYHGRSLCSDLSSSRRARQTMYRPQGPVLTKDLTPSSGNLMERDFSQPQRYMQCQQRFFTTLCQCSLAGQDWRGPYAARLYPSMVVPIGPWTTQIGTDIVLFTANNTLEVSRRDCTHVCDQ